MEIMSKVKRWLRVESEPVQDDVRKDAGNVEAAFLDFMREQSEMFGDYDTDGEPWVPAQYSLRRIGVVSNATLWCVGDDWGYVWMYVLDSGSSAEVVVAKSAADQLHVREDVGHVFADELDFLVEKTDDALMKWARGLVHKAQTYRVLKADEEQRYTLGVAYPADEIDSHGDFTSEDEVESAAWAFMRDEVAKGDPGVGTDHADGTDGAAQVVESYVYRGPVWEDENGDAVAKSGDWLVGAIWDEAAWDRVVKGELTGWSIQGLAFRDDSVTEPGAGDGD